MKGVTLLSQHLTASLLIESLSRAGVSYIFSNLGSDHPGLIEALAQRHREGKPAPKVIICPHEMVALSAAQGYTQATGKPQAVFVHVDSGTLNMGGAISNVARTRIPVLIVAGKTPYTLEGELFGSRNRPVNHVQDVIDQASIVRPYVKWEYDIRTGHHVQQVVYRGLQLATSDPKGPVYITGAREVLEEMVDKEIIDYEGWDPIEPPQVSQEIIQSLVKDLQEAKNPLIITSYLGRQPEAVHQLVALSERLAIPVIEASRTYMNYPANSLLHWGYQSEPFLEQADLILVIDSDVPWMMNQKKPSKGCKVYYFDVDPLKENLPLWYIPSTKFYRVDSYSLLQLLNQALQEVSIDDQQRQARYQRAVQVHTEQRKAWQKEIRSDGGVITPEWLTACLNDVLDEETIIVDETITNAGVVAKHLPRTKPGTFMTNGGAALGFNGGAAIGAKLAHPDKTVVSLTGDGSYYFSVPSAVHWMARRYQTPFLTVIYNNQGWNATKQNVLRLYAEGAAKQSDAYWVEFRQPSDLAKIAEAAGGAYAQTVTQPAEVKDALLKGLEEVKQGRSAVIDVRLAPISRGV
jgi:acetolactate synthase-1/2/3 large subunit